MRAVDPKDSLTGAPTIVETGLSVGDVVRTAYHDNFEDAAALAEPRLDPAEIKAAIDFCADEACVAAGSACPGCRKRTEALSLTSLDRFCAQFSAITFTDTGLQLTPDGPLPPAVFPSLDALSKTWAGEELWFLARRLIRRLKKQSDPRPKTMAAGLEEELIPSPPLILVRPQLADNIGMVARAMANFGLDDLRLVDPRDGWPNEKARAAASGANYIIDDTSAYPTLREAISDLHHVYATTARQRDLAKPILTPQQAVQDMREKMAAGLRCGFLFGPERAGLETDEVALADSLIMIPVNPRFASLNLAQAVLLLSYEWLKETKGGTLGRVTTYETPMQSGLNMRGSAPATKDELLGFFEHLETELERLGFFNPPHKRQTVVRNIQTMFARMQASEQEVRTLRGIVATLSRGKGVGRKSST